MAAGKFDLTAASKVLKEQYDPNRAYQVLVADSPFLGMIKREEGQLVGKNFKFAIQYGTGRGVATTLAKARAGKSTSLYSDVTLTRGRLYGVGEIDRETMEVAQSNKASFVDSLENQQEGILTTFNEQLTSWAFGNGGGSIGRIATGGISAATITLTDVTDNRNFQEDGIYELSSTDGTTGAIETGSLTCASVSRGENGTATVTFTANVTTGVPTAVAGMYIFPAGNHATHHADAYGKRVVVGLDGWIPTVAPTSTLFFGMDRSKDPTRLGGCRYNGAGAPIEESLQAAIASFAIQGANKIDTCIMNTIKMQELVTSLGTKCRYETYTNPQTKVGFEGITIATPSGKVAVFGDPACKLDRAYMLQKDTWRMLTLGECPKLIDEDGLTIRRSLDGTDGYTWEYAGYLQIACNKPGKNGVVLL